MKIKLTFAHRLLAIGLLVLAAFFVFRLDWQGTSLENLSQSEGRVDDTQSAKEIASASEITGKSLLTESASRLRNSHAVRAAARLSVNLFEQNLIANGHYSQLGQGTEFAKLELAIGEQAELTNIVQICNRGIYYRFQSSRQDPELQVADLRRIAESDSFDLFANQNTWLTTGGLSSLLENLVQNFEFEPVMETKIGSTPVYKLYGQWNEDRLKRFLFGQVKHVAIKDGIDWRELPVHLPQYCEILLGNDDYFPLFPYRITFLKQPMSDAEEQDPVAIVNLDLFEVEKNAALKVSDFDVNFGGTPPDDLTRKMVERIEVLNQIQRSAQKSKPTNQTR